MMFLYIRNEEVAYQKNYQVRDIVAYLEHHHVILPNGGHLTPGRWQHLGIDFGMSGQCTRTFFYFRAAPCPRSTFLGGIDRVHREWEGLKKRDRWNAQVFFLFPKKNGMAELVFRASKELETIGKMGYKTLQLIQQAQGYDGNPLYAILHEAIYCQGYYTAFAKPVFLLTMRFFCFF